MKQLSDEEINARNWESLKRIKTNVSEFANIWEQFVLDIIPLTPFKVQPPNYAELTGSLLKDINQIDDKYFQRGFQIIVLLSDFEYYFEKKKKGLWCYNTYTGGGYDRDEFNGTFREALTDLLKVLNAKVLGIDYNITNN